jgi:hypothetical protein
MMGDEMTKTLVTYFANGDVASEYPDFEPGQPVRIMPENVGTYEVTARTVEYETCWEFVGPTRHPYAAVIRETRYGTTVHMDRNRLLAL